MNIFKSKSITLSLVLCLVVVAVAFADEFTFTVTKNTDIQLNSTTGEVTVWPNGANTFPEISFPCDEDCDDYWFGIFVGEHENAEQYADLKDAKAEVDKQSGIGPSITIEGDVDLGPDSQ